MLSRKTHQQEFLSDRATDSEESPQTEELSVTDRVIQLNRPGPEQNWTKAQRRFLAVLQQPENQHKPVHEICQLAGYRSLNSWSKSVKDQRFVAAVAQLTGIQLHCSFTKGQQRILKVLQDKANHGKTVEEICRLAQCERMVWQRGMKRSHFAEAVKALGVNVKQPLEPHISVTLSQYPEEELKKDIWDIRKLKAEYPKHMGPATYCIDFSWIENTTLREQVKRYFRQRLPKWEASTFKNVLRKIHFLLAGLPPDIHFGTITRHHIESILPQIWQRGDHAACAALRVLRTMLDYMATSASWPGPRPPRNLIWKDDIPSRPHTLPRPIPPQVLDQLDPLLEQAVGAMKQGKTPSRLSAMFWDAIVILRHTGMRYEDLAHLKAPDEHDRNGCLDQDSDGYWWIRIDHQNTKMKRDHRIPTKMTDGVVDAIRRQRQRVERITDHFGEHYLFRTDKGVLSYHAFHEALKKLAPHLTYEDQPYRVAPHQFRHTIATDMIEQGVDIYTVKEFLGHATLSMTEKYVKVYLSSLKAKYDAYRVKKQQTSAYEMMNQMQVAQPDKHADGGWVEGKVGKLYISPLPDGLGNCAHLPMHDGCPDSPHCPTCPKLRANTRHLPVWESRARNLLITVEALRANPAYARARQKHEQELHHAEKVIETINREGFWDGRIHNN